MCFSKRKFHGNSPTINSFTGEASPTYPFGLEVGASFPTIEYEDVIATKEGDYAAIGHTFSSDYDIPNNQGWQDIFIVKLNKNNL